MNIIVCRSCGVLLDPAHVGFVDENHMHDEWGRIDDEVAMWSTENSWGGFVPFVPCPVCKAPIMKVKEGE